MIEEEGYGLTRARAAVDLDNPGPAERDALADMRRKFTAPPADYILPTGSSTAGFDPWVPERTVNLPLVFSVIAIVCSLLAVAISYARAEEHDWSGPIGQWVQGLVRPDIPKGSAFATSCCGKGDMYEADIYSHSGDEWQATITEGSAKTFPDGQKRLPIPNGTVVKFPSVKVNPPEDGNPTGHAQIFLSVNDKQQVVATWCFIPLPSGS